MDQDTLDKLASGEYSISPRSGRLRKRVRIHKKKPFFKRTKIKKRLQVFVWVLLLIGFVVSLVLVLPELDLQSNKKKDNMEKMRLN